MPSLYQKLKSQKRIRTAKFKAFLNSLTTNNNLNKQNSPKRKFIFVLFFYIFCIFSTSIFLHFRLRNIEEQKMTTNGLVVIFI